MLSNMEITALVPTLSNDCGLLRLVKQLKRLSIPMVIVDNQPNPVKQHLSSDQSIIYLPQTRNTGFAKAINLAATQARTKWLLVLNDDIELLKINHLLNFALKNKLAVAAPVLVNKQGRAENYGYRVLPYGKVELNLDPKNKQIDGLTAACLLIQRSVFQKIGGFDERFFAYLEDVDLFLRLKQTNYRFAIDPNSRVTHNYLTTSHNLPKGFKEWHDFKNWILLSNKHHRNFRINLDFLLERLRNLSGLLKQFVTITK